MRRKQTIYTCDACRTELTVDDEMSALPLRKWWALGPLGDYVAGRTLCSIECVRRMADAATDDGNLPLFLPERT